jgi:hypothetical protein
VQSEINKELSNAERGGEDEVAIEMQEGDASREVVIDRLTWRS